MNLEEIAQQVQEFPLRLQGRRQTFGHHRDLRIASDIDVRFFDGDFYLQVRDIAQDDVLVVFSNQHSAFHLATVRQ